MSPRRIQRRRTAGWTAPRDAQGRTPVYVGRPTRWANPFAVVPVGGRLRLVDLGDRSLSLREEPQLFAPADRHYARLMAARLYEMHTGPMGLYELDDEARAQLRTELAGRDLMCWCPLPEPGETDHCHASVLLELANGRTDQ